MSRRRPSQGRTLAEQADRYRLYLDSVQSPEHEAAFFTRMFKKYYGKAARFLREDFCGTAAVCCSWVDRHPQRRAIGVDLDPKPLAWAKQHNLARLGPAARSRIRLVCRDARSMLSPPADIVTAQNFSFFLFKTRRELGGYFRAARRNLNRQGLLVLDMMGGSEVIEEDREEIKRIHGVQYVWEQRRFDPITHDCEFLIHFRFRDGSELHRAFVYHWRLWTIPEVRELLLAAGFRRADVYWEGTNRRSGKGNDVYRRREHAPSEPAWICYIVAVA